MSGLWEDIKNAYFSYNGMRTNVFFLFVVFSFDSGYSGRVHRIGIQDQSRISVFWNMFSGVWMFLLYWFSTASVGGRSKEK